MRKQEINTPLFWLQDAGFSAYLVGNQVRDRLLKMDFDRFDVDIATSAKPKQVVTVLKKNNLIPTAVDEQFGVVSFRFNGVIYEITTFRQDIYKGDFERVKRYPDAIRFVPVAAEDSSRRDLTINAIYLNPKTGKYLDYHGGMADIKNKIIRVIGDPMIRFQEDPLRLLRVVRFRHLLKFKYDPATLKAMKLSAGLIRKLSPTIVKKEFGKLQDLPNYSAVKQELQRLGLSQIT
ncbi:TPA: hypothetical protein DHW58_02325 [Patescibacteria group bacterium]|uniref:tRNA nucleotidyltransferase/poly(A) polymerase n=2 Tax=Bacteria division Kazan-3B-28 TaxID=1798534 RepID=A0A0G2A4J6_UNCK3|nr:MAG: tRNA nucleotidyltransferase/poly(A) polymerase, poly(A) polymerase [candidate division Kazan bacterium GW2011_GWA1_50_15]KKW25837.1 MAG: tRNA nucleotidyltransferase/poly(A) polymerase [candidate division Kazan bacterium GW2011_GWC1_52_13]KKW27149.1 MAG: tRNA nucleotidyltransferase/poly(A) polymerase [candidate division Kazan bacterium GW2011_GWB1_52_7]OGW47219.1 MAG: hypothetical protein A2078_01930 [Nitrospirae bacterium GWC2_57_9]HCL47805.1 hypothetical protein [Patescibacteria group 